MMRNVKDEFVLAFASLAKGVGVSHKAFVVETQAKKLSPNKKTATNVKKARVSKTTTETQEVVVNK